MIINNISHHYISAQDKQLNFQNANFRKLFKLNPNSNNLNDKVDFNKFMKSILLAEGSKRVYENINGESQYSKFGMTKNTIMMVFSNDKVKQKYYKDKLNSKNDNFSLADARTVYSALINLPDFLNIEDTKFALMYADAVVVHGLTGANYFYNYSIDKKNLLPGENSYDAFIRMRIGAYLGESYVPMSMQKSPDSRAFALESWLKRLAIVEGISAGKPWTDKILNRKLYLDCFNLDDFKSIAKKWNISEKYLAECNRDWKKQKHVCVPTRMYILNDEDAITSHPDNSKIIFEKIKSKYPEYIDNSINLKTIYRNDNWERKYCVLIPYNNVKSDSKPNKIVPATIKIAKGDNLYLISKRYGITQEYIMKINKMTSPDLKIDQILKLKQ